MRNETLDKVRQALKDYANGATITNACYINNLEIHTFHKAISEFPELHRSYAGAQSIKAELCADECTAIADTDPDPQRARNRIQARQWYASKIRSDKYGDSVNIQVDSGPNLTEALQLARQRTANALLPVRYQDEIEDAQVTEIEQETDSGSTGNQPANEDNDDIFS